MVYSDATESDAPNKTAISTLAKRIEAFNDENIDNGGTEKVIIAINLGMLNNFIDSEEGESFTKLRQYVINNNIFSVDKALPFDPNNNFYHVDFSDYQLYTLTNAGVRSDYLTQLFRKIFAKTNDNPFYNAYCGNGNCDLHTRCPIRNNFEFLTNEKIQDFLVQKIIETSIKHKLVITSRDVLNFIYDAVVPHEFDEKAFWKNFNYPSKFLENYIKYTTPMLVFDNKGTSSLLDHMAELKVDNGNAEKRDSELLDFYASDEVAANIAAKLDDSCYKQVIVGCDLPSIDGEKALKKYLYKFIMYQREMVDESVEQDLVYTSFVKDLYRVYSGKSKELRGLYDSVTRSIYSWDGLFGEKLICLDDSNDKYSIVENLSISPYLIKTDPEEEVLRFLPTIAIRYRDSKEENDVTIYLDYALYRLIQSMKDGYRPSSQDCNIHADFVSKIKALIDLGEKRKRVFIVPKGSEEKNRYVFEETEFGYSFKEVRL
jgi:DNA phosphorothioation-dependent restriction protein DptF